MYCVKKKDKNEKKKETQKMYLEKFLQNGNFAVHFAYNDIFYY